MLNSIVLSLHIKQEKKGRACSWIRYKIKYLFRFDSKGNNLNADCDCSFLKINKDGERMLWTSYLTFNHYILCRDINFPHTVGPMWYNMATESYCRVLFKGRQLAYLPPFGPWAGELIIAEYKRVHTFHSEIVYDESYPYHKGPEGFSTKQV